MSKNISKLKNVSSTIIAAASISVMLAISPINTLYAKQAAATQASSLPKLGEFNLRSYDSMRLEYDSKTGANVVRLIKPVLTSPRYDFSGGNIRMTIQNGRAQTGIATGNVHVTVRDEKYDEKTKKTNKQTIQVDCSQARFTAGKALGQGRIDLTGNIVSKVYSSLTEGASVLTGETGFIEFLSGSKTTFGIDKGSATVTPIEPTPAPKKQ